MPDVIVVGGGVIGLSVAWELAGHGLAVRVLEQGAFGREASWAGAGMLPPGSLANARTPESRLRGATHPLWPEWSRTLLSLTGIDNGFIRCGGVEVRFSDSAKELSDFEAGLTALRAEGVQIDSEALGEIREKCPPLNAEVTRGYWIGPRSSFSRVAPGRQIFSLKREFNSRLNLSKGRWFYCEQPNCRFAA